VARATSLILMVEVADYQIQSAGHFQLGCDVGNLISKDDHDFFIQYFRVDLKEEAPELL